MGDRKYARRLFESLIGGSSPAFTNAAAEAVKIVQLRNTKKLAANANVTATNVTLDYLSNIQLSDNCTVTGFEVVPTAALTSSGTNYCLIQLWKRDAAGLNKNIIAELNTANLTAGVAAFVPVSVNLAAAFTQFTPNTPLVLLGGSIGIDTTLTAAGQGGLDNCLVSLTLRAE